MIRNQPRPTGFTCAGVISSRRHTLCSVEEDELANVDFSQSLPPQAFGPDAVNTSLPGWEGT